MALRVCSACGAANEMTAPVCSRCGAALKSRAGQPPAKDSGEMGNLLNWFLDLFPGLAYPGTALAIVIMLLVSVGGIALAGPLLGYRQFRITSFFAFLIYVWAVRSLLNGDIWHPWEGLEDFDAKKWLVLVAAFALFVVLYIPVAKANFEAWTSR